MDPGALVVGKDTLQVAVPGGYLNLLEIQLSGKKRMAVKEFLNGYKLQELAKLG